MHPQPTRVVNQICESRDQGHCTAASVQPFMCATSLSIVLILFVKHGCGCDVCQRHAAITMLQYLDAFKVWLPVFQLAVILASQQPVLVVCILHRPHW